MENINAARRTVTIVFAALKVRDAEGVPLAAAAQRAVTELTDALKKAEGQ